MEKVGTVRERVGMWEGKRGKGKKKVWKSIREKKGCEGEKVGEMEIARR